MYVLCIYNLHVFKRMKGGEEDHVRGLTHSYTPLISQRYVGTGISGQAFAVCQQV